MKNATLRLQVFACGAATALAAVCSQAAHKFDVAMRRPGCKLQWKMWPGGCRVYSFLLSAIHAPSYASKNPWVIPRSV